VNLYDDALCRTDRSIDWFRIRLSGRGADPHYDANLAAARALCSRCPVRAECLQNALDHPFTGGIWGGTTESERERMAPGRRRRSMAEHGTDSGYYHHRRVTHDVPCAACCAAHSKANSERERRATA
jgi:WhiB family redox-sensing transcriptional regulator